MHNVAIPAAPITTAHVPIMTLADIRKSFGPVKALKGVDVLIMPGEVHAIVGENGAGKSTLIGIAAGVLRPDAGAIYYGGKYVKASDPRQMREDGVAVVYQHPALAPDLTVLENLQLAAPSLGGPGGGAEAERLLARDRDRRTAHADQQARLRAFARAAPHRRDCARASHQSARAFSRRADRTAAARRRAKAVRSHRRTEKRRRRYRLRVAPAA